MPITSLPEHKIEVFVRFWPSGPPFSGVSSTKSRFLWLLPFGTLIIRPSEHKIGIFVLGVAPAALSQMTLVQFYRWGDAAAEALNR